MIPEDITDEEIKEVVEEVICEMMEEWREIL